MVRTILSIVGRRALSGILTLFLLLSLVFFMVRLVADPLSVLAGENATAEQIAAIEQSLGLDQPLLVQYLAYLGGVLHGDWGLSWRTGLPVWEMVAARMPATLLLSAVALLLAIAVAIPCGIVSAVRPGSWIDTVTRVVAVIGQSIPSFWLAILLVILFAVNLRWLPAGGYGSAEQLILPGIALSVYSIPVTMRLTRSAMLDSLGQDYIRTARSKGVSERRVIVVHGLGNAMIPIITVVALRVGHVISGTIVLEKVFAYPGMGSLGVDSMLLRDFPVVQFFIVFVGLLMILTSLAADVSYRIADPRVRVS